MSDWVVLELADTSADPIEQFGHWFADAQKTTAEMPESMSLATASADGVPSVRTVLCKGFDAKGFVFYTNYTSAKSQHLLSNPVAELLFYWEPLKRQVRIAGMVERVSDAESDAYFQQRPRGSQLAAWASPQSQAMDRAQLDVAFQEQEQRFADGPVSRPPFWGGFRVVPHKIEFWQGRDNRFHDRICYTKTTHDVQSWDRVRLAP